MNSEVGPELQQWPACEEVVPAEEDGDGDDDDGHDDDHDDDHQQPLFVALAEAETELEPAAAELFAEEEVAASPKCVLFTNLGYQRFDISILH